MDQSYYQKELDSPLLDLVKISALVPGLNASVKIGRYLSRTC